MKRFELVIFDCDGVVVDSERIVNEVFAQFVRSLGAQLDAAEIRELCLGRTLADCLAAVERIIGRKAPADALEHYRAERNRVLAEQVQPIEGVRQVVEQLDIPYCIASSGDREKMGVTLSATQLLELFAGRIFSATEVPRGKPAPDVFLHAAACMGVAPSRTVVVEDAVNGVLAGRAAGMTVLGFVGTFSAETLADAGAAATFEHMRDLPRLLEGRYEG